MSQGRDEKETRRCQQGDASKDGIDWEIEKVGVQFYSKRRIWLQEMDQECVIKDELIFRVMTCNPSTPL